MKGFEFQNDMKDLLKKQNELEKRINFNKVLERAGGDNALETKYNIQQVSDYFMDPVLSSLVRQYTERQMVKLRRQRIRTLNEVSLTKSKPQAKDVIPNRILEEQDEQHFMNVQNSSDMNENEIYISPLLPKKRKYYSTSKIPNILRESTVTTPLSISSPNNTIKTNINNISTSISYDLSNVQNNNNENQNNHYNNTDENNNNISENEDISENTGILMDSNDNDMLSATSEIGNMSTLQHPNIPDTVISRKFLTMATELKNSHLRSLRSTVLLDVIPRHRLDVNFSLAGKKFETSEIKDNNNNADNASQNDEIKKSTPIPLPKRKYKKKKQKKSNDNVNNNSSNQNDTFNSENLPINDNQIEITKADEYELIYTITICYPRQPEKRLQEFKMLGTQRLTDLRDILYCRMDFLMHGDKKNQQPDGEVLNQHKKKLSASYFFIDRSFYVDQRDPTEPDNSEHIRKLLNEREQGRFYNKESMNDITLNELSLKINEPYLFNHQKDCQHVVLIRDIRFIKKKEEFDVSKYPITTYSWRYTRYKCSMCMVYPAEYITLNDYLSGCSPCYFCKKCYRPFHFNKDGEKVTTFDVYDYHGS
ncbi:unnamed protein product [Cunninghamella echinulata]